MLTIGGEPKPILSSDFDEHSPVLSPDGRWLAYVSDDLGVRNVYVQAFPNPGRKWRVSPQSGTQPHWAPSGSELFYSDSVDFYSDLPDSERLGSVQVDPQTGEPGEPRVLFSGVFRSYQGGPNYSVAPDASRLLMLEQPEGFEAFQNRLELVLNWTTELKRLVPTG